MSSWLRTCNGPPSKGPNHERNYLPLVPRRINPCATPAKRAIETGENDLRRAAEHIAKAQEKGASQRLIALSIGKSPARVNTLLRWRSPGCQDETPFGPESKAKTRTSARSRGLNASISRRDPAADRSRMNSLQPLVVRRPPRPKPLRREPRRKERPMRRCDSKQKQFGSELVAFHIDVNWKRRHPVA
jgi:hypothetical protein